MSRSLFKVTLTLLILVGLTTISRAQDDEKIIRPSTKGGSAAWVFTFGGLGTMSMNGMTIGSPTVGGAATNVVGAGYKYYLSDDLALRAMLGFSTSSSGDAEKTPGGKNSGMLYGIGLGIEMHTRPVYSTSPYFGAQLTFAGGSTKNEQTVSGTTSETTTSGSSLGLGVMAGFDWYFTHGIAIGAEYMLGFGTSSSSSKNAAGTETDGPTTTTIGISNTGNIHAVVHF